jgi:RimJ/RimL family protein N-acetyltransferase
MTGHPWPLFDLRLRTPRLELRLPTDEDLLELLAVARKGVVEPGRDYFLFPWHELPSPAFERQFLLHWWRTRGGWSPQDWVLGLAVLADGRPIGIQDVSARDFAVRRTVVTGSWLGLEFQGRGYGTEMRAAVLALAFDGLGAVAAESGYLPGNASSGRVSEKLGYRIDGRAIANVSGRPLEETRLLVTRESWRRDLVAVTIEGLEPCLALFGAGKLGPDDWATL